MDCSIKVCGFCGKEFVQNARATREQYYCSHRCAKRVSQKRYNERERLKKLPRMLFPHKCVVCGKEFSSVYRVHWSCSKSCRKTRDNRRSKEGSTVSKINKVPCECCGFSDLRAINRHHLDVSKGNSGGVVCLCANCHSIYHAVVGKYKAVAKDKNEVFAIIRGYNTFEG